MSGFLRNTPRLIPADAAKAAGSVPLHITTPDNLGEVLVQLPEPARGWATSLGFKAQLGECLALPGASGEVVAVLLGYGTDETRGRARFHMTDAASKLPHGVYHLADPTSCNAELFALGWILDQYRFDRYKSRDVPAAELVAPENLAHARIAELAQGEYLVRDLINTPAEDMGPDELQAAAQQLADLHGAQLEVTVGDDLQTANLPLIHTVGRAAARAPRLIDLTWGTNGPLLTLVGKGVCFDTGGLNIKPGSSMGKMKKDMGGAANVLGLAHTIMAQGWPLRLRVLIPAVENNIAGNAFRPGDIFRARNGLTVEINNTDAEGRLVLADALALAAEQKPDQIISMATLTGAARVALGPDIGPFFTDDADLSQTLLRAGKDIEDPVWPLPFHTPYERMIEPGIADLDNAPQGGMAGAITAALFLRRFTSALPYVHFDIHSWTYTARPGHGVGAAGQGWRALHRALPKALGL